MIYSRTLIRQFTFLQMTPFCITVLQITPHCRMISYNWRAWKVSGALSFTHLNVNTSHSRIKPAGHSFKLHSTEIPKTGDAKYLGETVDSKLMWNSHISNIMGKHWQTNIYKCISGSCLETFTLLSEIYGLHTDSPTNSQARNGCLGFSCMTAELPLLYITWATRPQPQDQLN